MCPDARQASAAEGVQGGHLAAPTRHARDYPGGTVLRRAADALLFRPLRSRFGGLFFLGLMFVAAGFALRTAILICSARVIAHGVPDLARIYAVGLLYDLVTYFCLMMPVALYVIFVPDRAFRSAFNRHLTLATYCLFVFLMLLDLTSEWLFWGEFGCRFNVIAADHLIRTREALGDIIESYPVNIILGRIVVISAAVVVVTHRCVLQCCQSTSTFRSRLKRGLVYLAVPLLSWLLVDSSLAEISGNRYANELSKNGLYSLVSALRSSP